MLERHYFFVFSAMKLKQLPPIKNNLLNVIIETPKGCQNKYSYDEEYKIFKLKKTLPMGATFPFDFGFVPNTKGADGDPFDVLVIMDEHSYPGCWVMARIIGVLEAKQSEPGTKTAVRNDRIVAIANTSELFADIRRVKDLNPKMVEEIEQFFINYNQHEGKIFTPLAWKGRKAAYILVRDSRI